MRGLLIVLFAFIFQFANAQYREERKQFNYKDYDYEAERESDPYDPTISFYDSFRITGLGQMLAGESGRGLLFLGGSLCSITTYFLGMNSEYIANNDNLNGNIIAIGGAVSFLSIKYWSMIDAKRIAKVKNMAYKARQKAPLKINAEPIFITKTNSDNFVTGLSLKIKF